MDEMQLNNRWQDGSRKVTLTSVPVFFFMEGDNHIAFIPSLELSGYGKTLHEAQESLNVVLNEFWRYTLNKNTLLVELKRLGWKVKSKTKPITAPKISDLINSNDDLKDIVDNKEYSTTNMQMQMPAFA